MAAFGKNEATFSKPYFNMLAEKIENGDKVKFVQGGEQVIQITPEVKKFIDKVKSGNQNEVMKIIYPKNKWSLIFNGQKWTGIDKAPFSGQGGSGAGAEITAIAESLQCYVNSYLFNGKKSKLVPGDITKDNLDSTSNYVKADRTLEKCLKSGPKDWIDNGVYVTIANKIYSEYRTKFSGNVYFHRGSTFMNGLYAAKTACHKKDKASDSPQAPGSFGHDKWNPGDIWATTLGSSSNPLSEYTQDWATLNGRVAELSGILGGPTSLLGISLKKTTSATITKYRDPTAEKKNAVKYSGYIFGKNGNFFSSQDMYMNCSAGTVQFRTFSGDTSWQGEIKGKMAAGGKIGGGNVDFYARQHLRKPVFPSGGERTLFTRSKKTNESFLEEFYSLYVKCNAKQITPNEIMDYDTFKENCMGQQQKFLNSKYACLMLADSLIDSTSSQRNNFVDAIFRYASSDTDQSSFYIKVH